MALSMTLTGANADTISFDDENYVVEIGARGFGIPSPILRIDPSASNGGTYRFSKRDVREIDLPGNPRKLPRKRPKPSCAASRTSCATRPS